MANLNMRTLREMANFTQADMAKRLNMSKTAYSQLERGITVLNPEQKAVFVNLFGVHPNSIEGSGELLSVFNCEYTTAHYGSWCFLPSTKRIDAIHKLTTEEVRNCSSYTRLAALQLVVTTEYNRNQH